MTPARYRKPAQLARLGARHAAVEASAGTGKTYVLEHLVVDLVLTRGVPLDQILVVTFTEKATAELVHRVRAKLQELKDLRPEDPVSQAAAGAPDEACWIIDDAARRRLRDALFSFDRASISTIHGFCQRVLAENAFLHGRLFDEEAVDEAETFHAAFVEALRRELSSDPALLPTLTAWLRAGEGLDRLEETLARCHRELACLHPPRASALRPGPLDEAALARALAALPAVEPDQERLKAWLKAHKVHGSSVGKCARQLAAVVALAEAVRVGGDVLAVLAPFDRLEKDDGGLPYLLAKLGHIPEGAGEAGALVTALAAIARELRPLASVAAHRLLPPVRARLEARKREAGLFDFQDMLSLVARSLEGDGPRQRLLLATLRARYRHALIDEFQDTDEVQWSIFRRIFFESRAGHVLTVIGDPKQAIYGFRGADVHTYLRARAEIQAAGGEVLQLTENFRSTAPLIDAYNAVLDQSASPPFFREAGGIGYDHPVRCGRADAALTDAAGAPAPAVVVLDVHTSEKTLLTWQVKRVLQARMVAELRGILDPDGGLRLRRGGAAARVRAGDIYILTRTTRESREIGEVLRAARIPFAFFKQEKLFTTVEARDVLDLLRAIADPDDVTARGRAFITPFFGLSLPDLAACDDLSEGDVLLRRLYGWRALAEAGDFETLFARIVEESGVVDRALFLHDSERSLTNYLHLLELLQAEAARTRATVRELAQTLGAYVQGTRRPTGQNQDIQRLETDAAAVQIMTIHNAKGLEAAVVFLYGGFWPGPTGQVRVFHDEEGRRVVRVGPPTAEEERRHEEEQADEEKRVLYVALTRARARLYLPRFPGAFANLRGSYRFVNDRLHALLGGFTPPATRALFTTVPVPCPGEAFAPPPPPAPPVLAAWQPPPALLAPPPDDEEERTIVSQRAGFLVTSYSSVKRLHGGFVPADAEADNPAGDEPGADETAPPAADELPRGRLSGSFLHGVLEDVPLTTLAEATTPSSWLALPKVAAVFARQRRRHDRSPAHEPHAARLIHTALTAPVRAGDRVIPGLGTVELARRELEFLYPIPETGHALLAANEVLAPDADARAFTIGRGVVKGFIDLLFRHEGRVYVCDWKGDWLPAWDEARVASHCERNYGLQARLYTLAALRLLGVDGPEAFEAGFGGVLYCFLRGMRADDPSAGVYFRRPRWEDVLAWEREMLSSSFWGLS